MKRPDKTEMDRLLSRFARRGGESVRARNGQRREDVDAHVGTHLDADELNAYAEGALPESARSRYFAHLADCETCRKLVTELTLAATVSNEERAQRVAAATTSPAKSWRDLLASLFSPPVLRYGVPALALLTIIVVAIVATRTRQETSFVAQDKEAAQSYPSATTSNSNSSEETATTATTTAPTDANHANSNSATSNTATSNTASSVPPPNPATQSTPTAGAIQEKDKNKDAPTVAQTEVAKSTAGQRGGDAKQPATPGDSGKVLDESVTVNAAPPPAQAPVFSTSSTAAKEAENKREERKRGQTTENDDQVTGNTAAAGGATTPQPSVNGARDVQSRRAARTAQNQQTTKPAGSPKSEATNNELAATASAAEMRSVQGHKFRRQGSVWVDAAYNSSLSTTNVARGSEQYRALVADEPGLRAITQQLGGQVIVVWKGRAYRFY